MDKLKAIEAYWSGKARSFDSEPDHGLADPDVREAWIDRLTQWMPPDAVRVADLGCGTGSLSVLLAESGAEVVGVDLSPVMIEQAKRKASAVGLAVEFHVGDASQPNLPTGSFDVVLSRHVLWTLSDPVAALSRWVRLLRPRGRFVLIEGRWFDPPAADEGQPTWDGGVPASELIAALEPMFGQIDHYPLSDDASLWGKPIADERYAVVAHDAVVQRSPRS